jgi:predicted nucleic acid-binding protein
MIVVLDTFSTSSVTKRPSEGRTSVSDECHQWIRHCEAAGHRVVVPAISCYESLRELEQRRAPIQIARLKAFCLELHRFLPLATEDLELAAGPWGQARRSGAPTADPHALDADVLLAAQALGLDIGTPDLIVATTNPAHLSRYVPADLWTNIEP